MPGFEQMYKTHRKWILYLMSLYAIGWGITPYRTIFLGLILGTTVSLYNHWILYRKTVRFGNAMLHGKNMRSLGTFSRLAAAVLAAIIALKYPEYFAFYAMIIGIVTSYAILLIDILLQAFRNNN